MENQRKEGRSAALRIVLVYLAVGGLWILLSDRVAVALIASPRLLTHVQTAKGWFYVLATGWMLYALIRRDTKALRRANDALRDSEERYRQLFELSPDAVFVHQQGRIVLMNRVGASLLHAADTGVLIGKPVLDLVHPDDRGLIKQRMGLLMEGQSVPPAEIRVIRLDGALAYAELASTPFTYEGKATVLTLARDVTERKLVAEHKREFYRRTILAATDGKLVISEKDEVSDVAGPRTAYWHITAPEDLAPIRDDVRKKATSLGMDEARVYDLVLCVGEATTNALKHAGEGIASLHESVDGLVFMVSDEGPGIEALNLPEVALRKGYTTAASLGMGYKAMISLADKVYLATDPSGTTVAVDMKLHAPVVSPAFALLADTWAE